MIGRKRSVHAGISISPRVHRAVGTSEPFARLGFRKGHRDLVFAAQQHLAQQLGCIEREDGTAGRRHCLALEVDGDQALAADTSTLAASERASASNIDDGAGNAASCSLLWGRSRWAARTDVSPGTVMRAM